MVKTTSSAQLSNLHWSGNRTEPLHSQIGLTHKHLPYLKTMLFPKLYNYGYNGIIYVAKPESSILIDEVLCRLAQHKIIIYKQDEIESKYCVFVINRHKLEELREERLQRSGLPGRRNMHPKVPNIVYYDSDTGDMFFNGQRKRLYRRNKKMFDALFMAAPSSVSRKTMMQIARSGKYSNDSSMYVLNDALNLLRKACGVKANTIELSSFGCRINAECYPLSSQLPPSNF